jgi:hypothetical protein
MFFAKLAQLTPLQKGMIGTFVFAKYTVYTTGYTLTQSVPVGEAES